MKRTTLWKLAAGVLLLAVLLPLFPALNATPVNAVTTVPPLPYAMEQYGQHHSGIYFTDVAPSLDGEKDDSYVLMDAFTDSSGQFDGIFVAANQDGTGAGEIASEFVPDQMDLYGAYDSTYVYFYIETITRSAESYSITPKFGFNFSASQKDAQEGVELPAYQVSHSAGTASGEDYAVKTEVHPEQGNDSSGVYDRNSTVFEFRIAWSDIAPEGTSPEIDFDRMYASFAMPFDDATEAGAWWIYGVPNDVLLPSNVLVETAFGEDAGTYTPNVVNLLGYKVDSTVYPTPEILEVTRTDKNTNANRSFMVSYTISGVEASAIAETGILFTGDTASLGSSNMTVNTQGIQILEATLDSDVDGTLTYTATFSIDEADYEKFFTLRPYVKYSDDGAPTVYGGYYSNTSSYYDTVNSDYNQYLKVLMIGCSFSSYYTDELIAMCKAEGIHLTLGRIYYSGMRSHEHWDWLVDDVKMAGLSGELKSPDGSIHKYLANTYSMKEMVHFVDDWDVISIQDHYGIEFSNGDTYADGMASSMPYMPQLFRYLRTNFPEADLYIHQTWAFQLGYGYANGTAVLNEDGTEVIDGTISSSSFNAVEKRMMTKTQQTNHHNNIMKITNSLSEKIGVPMIPSGSAWAIARANEKIGDTLCDGKKGAAAGDYYHDGEGGGGQYLNACVWFEMLTGKDVREVTYKPTYSYPLTDEKAEAIREVAHQAVAEYKETVSWTGQTVNK